ncbi:MAG: diaminopimelate decarboxylase [Bacteroidales bacterium]|nr:diaminopimelate decarboxylase [Bacteroidales bacterium]
MNKTLPFSKTQIENIITNYPTPFHIYDEAAMLANAQKFKAAFAWNAGFKEFYAVKANPNPVLIKLLANCDFGCDCSSYPELVLAEKAGVTGENIMFTSNNTAAYEFQKARELGAIINLDDISHIEFLEQSAGLPDLISFRYNPGALKEGNAIIGHPEEAKYGLTEAQLFEGYKLLQQKGVRRFGIHTMVASNELNGDYFVETADIMFNLIIKLHKELGIRFEFVNLGGGIGIPYRPEQQPVDIAAVSAGIKQKYEDLIEKNGLAPLKLYFESGRYIAGPYGYLVTRVQHFKHTYRHYAGLDASMHNLMRPALYGAYHHLSVVGKEHEAHNTIYDVTGSLCENNDKFAIQRPLPKLEIGDIVVIHDSGAHGHSMGFNYNAKLRSAELLLRPNGDVVQIRRPETIDDYFATLDFTQLSKF